MSKITISFEGSIKSFSEIIPSISKLLAPAPLSFSIEETDAAPAVKRAPKKEAPTPPATASDDEKRAAAKREAAKRHAEKKKAEKAAAAAEAEAPAEEAAPAKPAKAAKAAKPAADAAPDEITMTSLRALAAKLPKTKLVPVLEDLGIAKLTELDEADYEKAYVMLAEAGE